MSLEGGLQISKRLREWFPNHKRLGMAPAVPSTAAVTATSIAGAESLSSKKPVLDLSTKKVKQPWQAYCALYQVTVRPAIQKEWDIYLAESAKNPDAKTKPWINFLMEKATEMLNNEPQHVKDEVEKLRWTLDEVDAKNEDKVTRLTRIYQYVPHCMQ